MPSDKGPEGDITGALSVLRMQAALEAAFVREAFPNAPDRGLEVEATTEFRKAAMLLRKTFGKNAVTDRLLRSPDNLDSLLAWCAPDWQLALYAAKLLRYIALCGQYEKRAFTPEERFNRTEREKRHAALMDKWEVQCS